MSELTPHFTHRLPNFKSRFKSPLSTFAITAVVSFVFLALAAVLDAKALEVSEQSRVEAAVAAYPPVCEFYGSCQKHSANK